MYDQLLTGKRSAQLQTKSCVQCVELTSRPALLLMLVSVL